MKKFIVASLTVFLFAATLSAQQTQPVPVDPAVRIGHLDNGLTYYIRHHEEPKGQANFYIAQKVGSILEEEDQRGLAHFLEHMCFNGTQKFPGNGVIKYCESIGVKFGADLNAYTSIDETVYNIDNVPVANVPSAVDSCLWILHDWADGLLLADEDIDKERGVIHEEWRTRLDATMRQYEQLLPVVYPGNRYGQRLPIGKMEVVDNFPYQALRDYYEKWYRPDQQGVVVVGDIDVDAVEAKIKEIFGTIATPQNPAERFYVQIEDNAEPIISITKDKEQPYALTYIFCKHDAYPDELKSDLNYLVYDYAVGMADMMVNERIQELLQSPEPPFVQAEISMNDDFFLSKTKASSAGVVVSSEVGLTDAMTTLYREMLRAARGGFTATEYERAKAEYLNNLESAYNQRAKVKSAELCSEYVRHFIDNEPIPGIENEFAMMQQLAPAIPVDVINQVIASFFGEGNLVVACMLPDKEGVSYPSVEDVKAALAGVAAEDIAPYQDEVSDEPLISELPAAGKVVKTSKSKFGYNVYKLSNGATVYVKPTDFNADQIIMSAYSFGGTSLYPVSESVNLRALPELALVGGVGNFSQTALTKALAGKKVSLSMNVGAFSEGVSGSTTPKDLETLLQLNYLYFTALRSDNDAFESWKNRTIATLRNSEADPMTAFQDTLTNSIYDHPERIASLKIAEVQEVDYPKIMSMLKERFANAADFVFIFTGNIDEQTALPLIEQYIGSLPSSPKKEKADVKVYSFLKGQVDKQFDRKMEIPMVTNVFLDNGKIKYNLKNSLAFDIALNALSVVLLEEIREKEGGTYGIGAYGSLNGKPKELAYVQIVYQTDPARYEYLNSRVREIVAQYAAEGPSEENLSKSKEYFLKNYKENLRENKYFSTALQEYLQTGVDSVTDFEEVLNSITSEDVRKVFAALLKQNNHAEVIMKGVN